MEGWTYCAKCGEDTLPDPRLKDPSANAVACQECLAIHSIVDGKFVYDGVQFDKRVPVEHMESNTVTDDGA